MTKSTEGTIGYGIMGAKKELIKEMLRLSPKYSLDTVFADWVECLALSIQNSCCLLHDKLWNKREEQYLRTIKKYTKEEQQAFAHMYALLVMAYEDGPSDVLGEIFMELGRGNKHIGQFFTPYNVSKLMAQLTLNVDEVSEDNPLSLHEPTVGAGGMVIAAADALNEKGINYQRCMDVVAQDLDWRAVYMAYIQLSLLGINAVVVQGDALTEPYVAGETDESKILRTPKNMGVLV